MKILSLHAYHRNFFRLTLSSFPLPGKGKSPVLCQVGVTHSVGRVNLSETGFFSLEVRDKTILALREI